MDTSNRVGNSQWCQSCLKRRVNKGYTQCWYCEHGKGVVDYSKLGYKAGYMAQRHFHLTFESAWNLYDKAIVNVPYNSRDDFCFGFNAGVDKYEDEYCMNAAFGFDF